MTRPSVEEMRRDLASRGVQTPSTNPNYLGRLWGSTGRQQAAGLPVSRQIARRGAQGAKEHPNRSRGALPPKGESLRKYQEASARFTRGFSNNKLRSADKLKGKGAAAKAAREMGRLGVKDVQIVGHTKGGKQLSLTRGKYSQKSAERLFSKTGKKGQPITLKSLIGDLMEVVYVTPDEFDEDDEIESISIVGY